MSKTAYIGAEIFDGDVLHHNSALLIDGEDFLGIVEQEAIPAGFHKVVLDGGTLLPGFVDLQVNGGGGVMFNEDTSLQGLKTMARAHRAFGMRAFLPTLITDTPEKTKLAIRAVEEAISNGVSGIIGLHLEGPHLSLARKGAHDPSLIRPMTNEDEKVLLDAAYRLPNLMVTVAPESVSCSQISRLKQAGAIVSLGHTDCSFDEALQAFEAGACCVTHLFNAMSQMGNREPGLVGAALVSPKVYTGLIADRVHVHPSSMAVAIAAKAEAGHIFLVTDAMSTAGSDIRTFMLGGRPIYRKDGRLTLEDGTLAGADLDIPTAIQVLVRDVGVNRANAYKMATSIPAALLNKPFSYGRFMKGSPWNGIYLDRANRITKAV